MERQKHVLVVDDSGDVRDVVALMLEDRGFCANAVASGAEARDFLERNDPVDAVVLDCIMPDESGLAMLAHFQGLDIPVVLISGSPEAIDVAEQRGIPLLRKPFRSDQLFAALDKATSR